MPNHEKYPFVSVVMPVRNEQSAIGGAIEAIGNQDYPLERLEIIVADGLSTDHTREKILKATQPNGKGNNLSVIIVDNPEGIASTGLNRAIRRSRGDVIIRVDGHCRIAKDYVSTCVRKLAETGADNVGGFQRAEGKTWLSQAVSLVTSSPFGVGNAHFRYGDKPRWTDTVYLGAYRREIFDKVGYFDETLVRNQDDELNLRVIESGGKIWLDPSIRSIYLCRSSLGSLWKQYYEYGFWKVSVIRKHPGRFHLRHFVPAVFVAAIIAGVFLAVVWSSSRPFLAGAAGIYSILSVAESVRLSVSPRGRFYLIPVLPVLFLILHLSYGVGFWAGIVKMSSGHEKS